MARWRPVHDPVNPMSANSTFSWGSLGSVLYTCSRLRRKRRRFQRFWPSREYILWIVFGADDHVARSPESTRLLHRWRMRCRRLPTTSPTPSTSRSRSAGKKGAMVGGRVVHREKRPITRGPPVVEAHRSRRTLYYPTEALVRVDLHREKGRWRTSSHGTVLHLDRAQVNRS